MKLLESFIREMGEIDSMQFGFVPNRGMTDAISSSSANCRRSISLQTSHFTWPLLIWRRLLTVYQVKIFGVP